MRDTKSFYIRENSESVCLAAMDAFGYRLISKQFVYDKTAYAASNKIKNMWCDNNGDLRIFEVTFTNDGDTEEQNENIKLADEYFNNDDVILHRKAPCIVWSSILSVVFLSFFLPTISGAEESFGVLSGISVILGAVLLGLFIGLFAGIIPANRARRKTNDVRRKRRVELLTQARIQKPIPSPEENRLVLTPKEQLLEAQKLLEDGLITSEEYETKRKKILGI